MGDVKLPKSSNPKNKLFLPFSLNLYIRVFILTTDIYVKERFFNIILKCHSIYLLLWVQTLNNKKAKITPTFGNNI